MRQQQVNQMDRWYKWLTHVCRYQIDQTDRLQNDCVECFGKVLEIEARTARKIVENIDYK